MAHPHPTSCVFCDSRKIRGVIKETYLSWKKNPRLVLKPTSPWLSPILRDYYNSIGDEEASRIFDAATKVLRGE